jgi:hypothetical protein
MNTFSDMRNKKAYIDYVIFISDLIPLDYMVFKI